MRRGVGVDEVASHDEGEQFHAQYDPLTALANRALFRDRLAHALAVAKRKKQEVGIILLGLDRFKTLSETLSAEAGDALLKETAERLKQCMREVDTVARLGGHEFTCLLEGINCRADMEIVSRRVLAAMAKPFKVTEQEMTVAASLGLTVYPLDGQHIDELLQRAYDALASAQESGGASDRFPPSRCARVPLPEVAPPRRCAGPLTGDGKLTDSSPL